MSAASWDQYSHQRPTGHLVCQSSGVRVHWGVVLSMPAEYVSKLASNLDMYIMRVFFFYCPLHFFFILLFALNVSVCMQMSIMRGTEVDSFPTAVLCIGWECLKGLLESPWETHGMRGRRNCGWQSWGHPEDEVRTDLCCILKDHQHTRHPGDHLCLFIPWIQLPRTKWNSLSQCSTSSMFLKIGPLGSSLTLVVCVTLLLCMWKTQKNTLVSTGKPKDFFAGGCKQATECALHRSTIEIWKFLIGRMSSTVYRWTKCSILSWLKMKLVCLFSFE